MKISPRREYTAGMVPVWAATTMVLLLGGYTIVGVAGTDVAGTDVAHTRPLPQQVVETFRGGTLLELSKPSEWNTIIDPPSQLIEVVVIAFGLQECALYKQLKPAFQTAAAAAAGKLLFVTMNVDDPAFTSAGLPLSLPIPTITAGPIIKIFRKVCTLASPMRPGGGHRCVGVARDVRTLLGILLFLNLPPPPSPAALVCRGWNPQRGI